MGMVRTNKKDMKTIIHETMDEQDEKCEQQFLTLEKKLANISTMTECE